MLLSKIKQIVPALSPTLHKGQAGRTLIIGGSENYTGAPYYSCVSSMLLGADMGHIICERNAGPILKSMSPDLIVFPLLREEGDAKEVFALIQPIFERVHVVVIGPGLGRNEVMMDTVVLALKHLRTTNLPVVIDADGLWIVNKHVELVRGWKNVILTPNVMEFKRLWDAAGLTGDLSCEKLCHALDGVTILQKGQHDVISNGKTTYTVDIEGGLKRCGGQGDVLSGTTGTFMAWYYSAPANKDKHYDDGLLLCAAGGSMITRTASKLAFKQRGRSMMSTDVVAHVGAAYHELFAKL